MILDAYTHYAGFWRRFAAALLDGVLFSLVGAFIVYLVMGPEALQEALLGESAVAMGGWLDILINYLLPFVITVFFWVRYLGTPGKLLMGCNVVDARTGEPLTVRQAVLRYFGYILSALPLGLGFLWIAWDKQKRGFHDRLADTLVVVEDEAVKTLDELVREAR